MLENGNTQRSYTGLFKGNFEQLLENLLFPTQEINRSAMLATHIDHTHTALPGKGSARPGEPPFLVEGTLVPPDC